MRKIALVAASAVGAIFLGSAALPSAEPSPRPLLFARSELQLVPGATKRADFLIPAGPVTIAGPEGLTAPPPPPPPTPSEALADGVLIVVSLASQRAFVFRKGELWDSTDVSTGKAGNETPEGIFPILQKKVHHRSTLYDDAPMPFMQRLTWDGVALHSGRVPGYPASHGCIRLPDQFARKLYKITGFTSTIVVVTGQPVGSASEARELA